MTTGMGHAQNYATKKIDGDWFIIAPYFWPPFWEVAPSFTTAHMKLHGIPGDMTSSAWNWRLAAIPSFTPKGHCTRRGGTLGAPSALCVTRRRCHWKAYMTCVRDDGCPL